MNVLRSNYVFPSYSHIKKAIVEKKQKDYERTIRNLTEKLTKITQSNHLQADHEKIKDQIIMLAAENTNEKVPVEKENLMWVSSRSVLDRNNHESLNYYIQDDKEEENNYQTYLKFKKKALERDLQEDRNDRLSGKDRKKQQEQEQHLFKNLYERQTTDSKQKRKNHRQFSYINLKNHAQTFKRKIDRVSTAIPNKRGNNPSYLQKNKEKIIQELQQKDSREKILFQKNKKLLIENYTQILKKLDTTNIVKWRILKIDENSK